MRARLADARRCDEGLSLVELSVAILLFGIVLSMVWGFYSAATSAYKANTAQGNNTAVATNAMDEVARIVRASTQNPVQGQAVPSPAFVSASNEALTVYAFVNLSGSTEQPLEASFLIDSNRNLIEKTWPGSPVPGQTGYWSFPSPASTPATTRTLGGPIATQSGSNPYVFTYLSSNGTVMTPPAGGFTSAQLQTIAAVQVTITVGTNTNGSGAPVTLQNTVGLPNLNIARTQ